MVANAKSVNAWEGYEGAVLVPMSEILLDGNIREIDQKHVDTLRKSIKAGGLNELPRLERMDGGGYRILAGFHRVHALKALKWEFVPATLGANTMHGRLVSNLVRLDMTPIEIARQVAALVMVDGEESDAKVKEVGAALGRPVSYVRDYLKLVDNVIGEFQDLLGNRASGFTKEHGLTIAKAPKADQETLFRVWKASGGVSAETVAAWVKNPTKAAENYKLQPVDAKADKKAAVTTGEKPVNYGSELTKAMANLIRKSGEKELVADAVSYLITETLPMMVNAVTQGAPMDNGFESVLKAVLTGEFVLKAEEEAK